MLSEGQAQPLAVRNQSRRRGGRVRRRALEEYVRHGVRPTADGEVELSCRRETEARGYLLMESQIAFQLFEVRGSSVRVCCNRVLCGSPGCLLLAYRCVDTTCAPHLISHLASHISASHICSEWPVSAARWWWLAARW